MGRRPVDPALALSRTIGISVLVAEHETWLQMPMPERRRISLALRQLLREELGFGASDVRAQLLQASRPASRPRAGPLSGASATRKASSAAARVQATPAQQPPPETSAARTVPEVPDAPVQVAPRAPLVSRDLAQPPKIPPPGDSPAPAELGSPSVAPAPADGQAVEEPQLDLDGWV
jgi:hypothetical protein